MCKCLNLKHWCVENIEMCFTLVNLLQSENRQVDRLQALKLYSVFINNLIKKMGSTHAETNLSD